MNDVTVVVDDSVSIQGEHVDGSSIAEVHLTRVVDRQDQESCRHICHCYRHLHHPVIEGFGSGLIWIGNRESGANREGDNQPTLIDASETRYGQSTHTSCTRRRHRDLTGVADESRRVDGVPCQLPGGVDDG